MSEYKSIEQINEELREACSEGNLEIVNSLLSKNANIHNKDYDGYSPIILASKYGHLEIVELLISKGANIYDRNKNSHDPICMASFNGNIDLVKLLLLKGANYRRFYIQCFTGSTFNLSFMRHEIRKLLQNWPLTMCIIVLQELFIYHFLDCDSFIDFIEYYD
jgi:hypothetical protein